MAAVVVISGCGVGVPSMDSTPHSAAHRESSRPALSVEKPPPAFAGMLAAGSGGDAGMDEEDAGVTQPSGPVCGRFAARATPEELLKSPRPSYDAEGLAIETSGAFVAPDDVYAQINADLNAIRAGHPEVDDVHVFPRFMQGIWVQFDPAMAATFGDAGPYPWDCLNAYYGGTTRYVFSTDGWASIHFDQRQLDENVITTDYAAIPGLLGSSPMGFFGDGSDICMVEENGDRVYIFDHASGDCSSGCTEHEYYGFSVNSAGVAALGAWAGGMPLPAWFTDRPDCTKNLGKF
jgi:hypothetical protein